MEQQVINVRNTLIVLTTGALAYSIFGDNALGLKFLLFFGVLSFSFSMWANSYETDRAIDDDVAWNRKMHEIELRNKNKKQ